MRNSLRHLAARLQAFFRNSELDHDFDDELHAHVALLTEEHVRRGKARDEAERVAYLEVGGRARLREDHRETRGVPFLDTLLQDLRYTFRTLRRDTGFTTFAI